MKEPEPRPKLVRDPEVQAMDRLSRVLEGLEPGARQRVVQWLKARYVDGTEPLDDQEKDTPY